MFAPDGAGHTRRLSPEVDSRLGLQLTADLTPRLTGVLQVITQQRHDDTYTPEVEWANLKYDITPDLSVRAGRIVQGSFMASEYRNVGYAMPWVRPPEAVYRLVSVTNIDGIDFSYRSRLNNFTNTLRGTYSRSDSELPGGFGEIEARKGITIIDTLEWGAATLFGSYGHFHLTFEEINPFFDAFRQFGPEGEAIADRYDVDDKEFEVVTLGARYDPGDWFAMGEWARADSRTFLGDMRGWYVTGGYRIDDFTPYVTLAGVRVAGNTSDPGLSTAGLPPPAAAQAGQLNNILNLILGSGAQQQSVSLGTRWDFARNAALKVQYDHLDLDEGSPGTLTNIQSGFEPGGTVNLFSIAVDFVF